MVNALDDLVKISNMLSERLECWTVIPTPHEKIESFQNTISVVENEIKILEKQIDEDMKKIAPNITSIVGSQIGARLISLAGSIEKLAYLPASTIQILGAEKALFRFKKEGGKPPKHGVIFQHHLINRSSLRHRGKISRLLANKITMAVKADVFTKRDISNILKSEIEVQVKKIRNK
jgi:nucleolar protein 56